MGRICIHTQKEGDNVQRKERPESICYIERVFSICIRTKIKRVAAPKHSHPRLQTLLLEHCN